MLFVQFKLVCHLLHALIIRTACRRFEDLLNVNTSRVLMCKFASRWTNMRLCIVTSSIVSFISLIIFLLQGILPTSYAGAALIYAFQVSTLLIIIITVKSKKGKGTV